MSKITTNILLALTVMGLSVLPSGAEIFCGGVSEPVRVDQTSGTRTPKATETIVYSPFWSGAGDESTVDMSVQPGGEFVSGATKAGTYLWTVPTESSTYTLRHETWNSGTLVDTLTATFEWPTEPILAKPTVVANADAAVYTNGHLSAETAAGSGCWHAWSNLTATVVYTAKAGYHFEDGTTEKTVRLDTRVSPAILLGEVPAAPGKPTVQLGVVAQRYPWNGVVDVNYKTEFWLAGKQGAVEITAGDQVYTNNLDIYSTGKGKTGVASHAVDLKWLFGEMKGNAQFKAITSDQPIGFVAVKRLAAGEFPADKADKACMFRSMDTVTSKDESQVSPYAEWKVDLVLTAEEDIDAKSISLAGLLSTGDWLELPSLTKLEAGKEVAVVKDWIKQVPAYSANTGLPPSWHWCSKTIKKFTCGVKNQSPANTGKKLKVTMRLTSNEDAKKTLDIATIETVLVAPKPE